MRRIVTIAALFTLPLPLATAGDPRGPLPIVKIEHKGPVSYEKEIAPIFQAKCSVCHAGNVKRGKLDMSSLQGLLKGGGHGPALVASKSAASLIVQRGGRTAKPFMPPKDEEQLTPQELALVKLWIDQGAKAGATERLVRTVTFVALPAIVHPVRAVAVAADKSVIAAGRGNQIDLYKADKGGFLKALADPQVKSLDGKPAAHLALVDSLAFSPDSKTLASGSFRAVTLWDVATGKPRQRLKGFADRVVALAFSADGKWLATGGGAPTEDGEIKVFDAATGKLVVEIKNGHSDTVFGVCFSPDSKMLATCAADKFVKVFAMPSGKFLKSFEGHTHQVLDVGWRADGKVLASAGADKVIKVWDYEKGEQVRTIPGHGKQVTRLQFIGKTPTVLTCSGDQTARVWNVNNGGSVRTFGGSSDFLYAAAASPDGTVVVTGGQAGVVRLYNGKNGQLVKELLPPGVATAKK